MDSMINTLKMTNIIEASEAYGTVAEKLTFIKSEFDKLEMKVSYEAWQFITMLLVDSNEDLEIIQNKAIKVLSDLGIEIPQENKDKIKSLIDYSADVISDKDFTIN